MRGQWCNDSKAGTFLSKTLSLLFVPIVFYNYNINSSFNSGSQKNASSSRWYYCGIIMIYHNFFREKVSLREHALGGTRTYEKIDLDRHADHLINSTKPPGTLCNTAVRCTTRDQGVGTSATAAGLLYLRAYSYSSSGAGYQDDRVGYRTRIDFDTILYGWSIRLRCLIHQGLYWRAKQKSIPIYRRLDISKFRNLRYDIQH